MATTLIARYQVQPGKAELVENALRRMAEAVRADEPACLLYNANVAVDDPNLFCLYEVYEDDDAVIAHRETPHFQEIIEGVIVPVLVRRERELFRRAVA
ncbi:putative quinol monooxygenase [Microbacterium sp. KR10-403]|uniref:putative quinol monooxygenase n=1 Tax=Microbacterium sp. KR10-403 TaxID=3158581 RepID=UPI0032E4E0E5